MKVSVIIPCYNSALFIKKAVVSIFEQTFENLELICVDDGSTDNTVEILKELKKYAKIPFYIIELENGGACRARNLGLEKAEGDYIQFLDADDYLLKDKIKKQVELLDVNSYPSIVIGSFKKMEESGVVIQTKEYLNIKGNNIWNRLIVPDLGNTCANLFSMNFFSEGGKWNENLQSSQEYSLMFDILKFDFNIVFDHNIETVIVRRQAGSISTKDERGNHERYLKLRIDIKSYLLNNDIEFDKKLCDQTLFDRIRILYKFDAPLALQYFNSVLGSKYKPIVSDATGANYIKLYKVLGFKLTQKIKSIL